MLPFHEQIKHWALKDDMRGFDCLGAEIGATYTPAPSLADVRSGRGVITYGMKGDSVMYVQGLVGTIADGEFGPATEKAVTTFNDAHGLGHNGVVGAKTLAALDVLAQGGTAGVTKIDFSKPEAPSPSFPPTPSAPKSTALIPAAFAAAQPNWWTSPAWSGGLERWKVASIGTGGAVGLGALLAWLLSSKTKVAVR